jgi:serine/threonine protein phosphatase 1
MGSPNGHIIIGDIHGCAESLIALVSRLEPYQNRRFVFLGDYIDRGSDSFRVIDFLIGFSKDHDCIFLRGNHEHMALEAFLHNDEESWDVWMQNGGKSTLDSYTKHETSVLEAEGHLDFLIATDFYYETNEFVCVHAGMNPSMSVTENLKESDPVDFLWERRHVTTVIPSWEKTVLFGHTPVKEVKIESNMIGLDTGCVFSDRGYGTLSALLMPEKQIIDVKCKDKSLT